MQNDILAVIYNFSTLLILLFSGWLSYRNFRLGFVLLLGCTFFLIINLAMPSGHIMNSQKICLSLFQAIIFFLMISFYLGIFIRKLLSKNFEPDSKKRMSLLSSSLLVIFVFILIPSIIWPALLKVFEGSGYVILSMEASRSIKMHIEEGKDLPDTFPDIYNEDGSREVIYYSKDDWDKENSLFVCSRINIHGDFYYAIVHSEGNGAVGGCSCNDNLKVFFYKYELTRIK